jgi:hypothetical protein
MYKKSLLFSLGLCQIVIFLIAAEKPAHAYVDPGSGLLFFQVAGSMLAGALFVLRTRIRKLFGLKPPAAKSVPQVTVSRSSAEGETHA